MPEPLKNQENTSGSAKPTLRLSEKGKKMPPSPIRKLASYAEAAERKGITVHTLSIGQPDIPAPQVFAPVWQTLAREPFIPYTHSAGNYSYRKALAAYYQKYHITLQAEDILITNGGSEALQIALCITCNKDDEVIVPEPFYTNYNAFALQNDVTLVPLSATIESGFALPAIADFEKKITPKTKGILLCNPGNPTGTVYTRSMLEQIGALAKKYHLYLFADEVYRELCYTETPYFSCMHLSELEQHVILIDSVSKRYSLCGARVGALITRNQMVQNAALRYAQSRLCASYYGQVIAEQALQTPASYFEEVKNTYKKRRDILYEGLNNIPGVLCTLPMGAFYIMARLPVADADTFAQWLLEDFSYAGESVLLAPAGGFYVRPENGKDQIRIAYVLEETKLKKALACLKEGLKTYPGSRQ